MTEEMDLPEIEETTEDDWTIFPVLDVYRVVSVDKNELHYRIPDVVVLSRKSEAEKLEEIATFLKEKAERLRADGDE